MSNFARLFEEEKEEAAEKAAEKATNDTIKKIVHNMLKKEMDVKDIMEVTGLTEDQIKKLKNSNE